MLYNIVGTYSWLQLPENSKNNSIEWSFSKCDVEFIYKVPLVYEDWLKLIVLKLGGEIDYVLKIK